MKNKRFIYGIVFVLFLLSGVFPVSASAGPSQNELLSSAVDAAGGPDGYGYTWTDTSFNWMDATSGTQTILNNNSSVAIESMPFPFKFYGDSPAYFYATPTGYISFGDSPTDFNVYTETPPFLPFYANPNNLIAPYFVPYGGTHDVTIYTLAGGTAPNRYQIVEWYQMPDSDGIGKQTFEAVLYENGNILFQYQDMNYSNNWKCALSGIEDDFGQNGLVSHANNCEQYADNFAVLFTPPASVLHVQAFPTYVHGMVEPGGTYEKELAVINNGTIDDVFDFQIPAGKMAAEGPTIELYNEDGETPVPDTNNNRLPDTGVLSKGSTFSLMVKVTLPAGFTAGQGYSNVLQLIPNTDPNNISTVDINVAVPAPFASIMCDGDTPCVKAELVKPGQTLSVEPGDNGSMSVITELPGGGFFTAYSKTIHLSSETSYAGIAYQRITQSGDIVQSGMFAEEKDGLGYYFPVVAAAPNGNIGILWKRMEWKPVGGKNLYNHNLYFAVLSPDASTVILPPTNITKNKKWAVYGTPNLKIINFDNPALAATSDGYFVAVWRRFYPTDKKGGSVQELYREIFKNNGKVYKPASKFVSDSSSQYTGTSRPRVVALANKNVLITWDQAYKLGKNDTRGEVRYAVMNSKGKWIKKATTLDNSNKGKDGYVYSISGTQVSNGNLVFAWSWYDYNADVRKMRYAVLNSKYKVVTPATVIDNPLAVRGNYPILTHDDQNHAIILSADIGSRVFYTLLNGDGTLATSPLVYKQFDSKPDFDPRGYGLTTNLK